MLHVMKQIARIEIDVKDPAGRQLMEEISELDYFLVQTSEPNVYVVSKMIAAKKRGEQNDN